MVSSPLVRAASETRLSLSHITAQNETNLLGTVHGGVIMTHVDSVAGVVAARHSGGPAVTASMDEMVFLVPVRVGDVVHFSAQVNWTGRSSMEVGVRITADRWDSVGPQVHVASAYLVFVAVDEDGRPREVPQVAPVTDEDRRRLREAEIRRSHRLARRAAIIASRQNQPHEEQPREEHHHGEQPREEQPHGEQSREVQAREVQAAQGQSRGLSGGEQLRGERWARDGQLGEGESGGEWSAGAAQSREGQSREGRARGERARGERVRGEADGGQSGMDGGGR